MSEIFTAAEPCTTHSRRFRHLSVRLAPDKHAPRHPGQSGRTLCGASGDDEERANYWLSRWSSGRTVLVASLPICSLCERAERKRKREADRAPR